MSSTPLRVGLVTHNDPTDAKSWSGTYRSMYDALGAAGVDLHLMPWTPAPPSGVERVTARLRPPQAAKRGHDWTAAAAHARAIRDALRASAVDVLFAVTASTQVARLRTDLPMVYSSDATFRLNVERYPTFSGLPVAAVETGDRIERAAVRRARLLVYPSKYAADSAIRDYGADPTAIRLVPYGPNLPAPASVPPRAARTPATVLFVGMDWMRKGGDIAVDAVQVLRGRGRAVRLVTVGARPPTDVAGAVAESHHLDRRNPEQARQLCDLFASADVLVLPSRADCSPIVLCEAAAFGLPAVAGDVGGIPEIVRDGETGRLLSPNAPPEQWAAAIGDVLDARAHHAAAARAAYDTRLNWTAWAQDVVAALAQAAGR